MTISDKSKPLRQAPTDGMVAGAREELKQAADDLERKPGRETFWQAVEEHRKGTPESLREAIRLYQKAIGERPEYPMALRNLSLAVASLQAKEGDADVQADTD